MRCGLVVWGNPWSDCSFFLLMVGCFWAQTGRYLEVQASGQNGWSWYVLIRHLFGAWQQDIFGATTLELQFKSWMCLLSPLHLSSLNNGYSTKKNSRNPDHPVWLFDPTWTSSSTHTVGYSMGHDGRHEKDDHGSWLGRHRPWKATHRLVTLTMFLRTGCKQCLNWTVDYCSRVFCRSYIGPVPRSNRSE